MLNVLDKFLENLFAYGIPILVFLWTSGVCILALGSVISLFAEKGGWFPKIEMISFAVINVCCCIWFFHWKNGMGASQEGYSHINATIALLIAFIVWMIPVILRNCLIPFTISAVVYLGIVIFGL